jgi:hypothetical protein
MGETPVALVADEGRRDATVKRRAASRPDPAMSIPTPLMVEPVGAGGDVLLQKARAAQDAAVAANASDRPPPRENRDKRVDTLATRPLETAVRDERDARPEPKAPRSRVTTVVAIAALLAVGGGVLWRTRASSTHAENGPASTASSTATTSTGSVVPTAATSTGAVALSTSATSATSATPSTNGTQTPPGGVGLAGHGGPASDRTGATATSSPSASSASGAEKTGRSMVAFLGDPGTRVSIDGTMRGPCPVRVSLDSGQHDVRFTFDPTGESRGERISVKPGEKITVRAEFTGATPTVRIQR